MSSSSSHLPKKLVPALIWIWVIIFLAGAYGHRQLKNTRDDSLFKSLQLFHLHYSPFPGEGASEGGTPVPHPAVPFAIQFARFGAALWGLALLPLMVVFLFEHRLFRWRVGRFWTGHYVVCGECSRSLSLVRDLRRKGRQVVFVGRCGEMKDALPSGVLYLGGDSGDTALLRKSAVHRASFLVALHEDDRANVETLVAAGNLCSLRSINEPLNSFAYIADTRLAKTLRQLSEPSSGVSGTKIREHFFNYYELIARLLVRRFPLLPSLGNSRPQPEHIVIVGFAAFGQCVALKIIKMAQQLYRECVDGKTKWQVAKPKITIVDPQAESLLAEFLRLNPPFLDYCQLEHCSISTTDPRFQEMPFLAHQEPGTRTTLVFCLETEAVTLRAISLVVDISRSAQCPVDRIFLRIAKPERLGRLLEKLHSKSGKPEIVYVAPDSEVFNADVLLSQRMDILAREIHSAWLSVEAADRRANNQPPATGKTWEELSEEARQSNREAADHLWAKLRLLGYELEDAPENAPKPSPNLALLTQLKEREEELARAEHCRWMIEHVLAGWVWGEKRGDKVHPDMVEYDKLRDSTKEKDRVNVRVIPKLLSEGRLKAVVHSSAGHGI